MIISATAMTPTSQAAAKSHAITHNASGDTHTIYIKKNNNNNKRKVSSQNSFN